MKNNPTAADIKRKILEDIRGASENRIQIRSGDVARAMKAEPAACSSVMKTLFRSGDKILKLPGNRTPQEGTSFEEQTGGQNHAGSDLVIFYVCSTVRSQSENSNVKVKTEKNNMRVPKLESLACYGSQLAEIVAATSYLPHPEMVKKFSGAVFPTIRNPVLRRNKIETDEGECIGMYDDNTTPRWALFWAHGIPGVAQKPSRGWTIAHVWDRSKDIDAYTHLANLALLPECFASLSDKQGPLTLYLRFHAWKVYGWKPTRADEPVKPEGYDEIGWRYFDSIDDPIGFLRAEFAKANCSRSKILKPLMRPPLQFEQ